MVCEHLHGSVLEEGCAAELAAVEEPLLRWWRGGLGCGTVGSGGRLVGRAQKPVEHLTSSKTSKVGLSNSSDSAFFQSSVFNF